MYLIIGGDSNEYGPITDADIRKWIGEGRLNAQSLAKAESDAEFRPLSTFPEFADALGLSIPKRIAPLPSSGFTGHGKDYDLDIGGCISRGYQLLKDHFNVVFLASLLYIGKQMDFGAAMKASWKMVNKHWWQVFGSPGLFCWCFIYDPHRNRSVDVCL